jgi:hypothetical protein
MEERMIIAIDNDNLLLVFESESQAAREVGSDPGWDIDEVDFYTDKGQHLMPKDDGSGVYRLVPHGRAEKKNLFTLLTKAHDVVLSRVFTIKSVSDLKKALSLENGL